MRLFPVKPWCGLALDILCLHYHTFLIFITNVPHVVLNLPVTIIVTFSRSTTVTRQSFHLVKQPIN